MGEPRSSDTQSFPLGVNMFPPPFGKMIPSPSSTGESVPLPEEAASNHPTFNTSSLSHFDAASQDQERGVELVLTSTGQQSQATVSRSRSGVLESKTPVTSAKDSIAALKMRAKESVMTKRVRSVRSASSDSKAGPIEVLEPEANQKEKCNNVVQADEQNSKSHFSGASMRASSIQANKPPVSTHKSSAKTITTELEDLLAEGRAAASMATGKNDQIHSPAEGHRGHHDLQTPCERDVSEVGEIREDKTYGNLVSLVEDPAQTRLENFPADEINEIDTWLAMTGYYDKPYRDKVLGRRKRLQEIEEERLRLLEEEREDQRLRAPLNNITPFSASKRPEPPANKTRPPAATVKQDLGLRIKDSALRTSTRPDETMPTDDLPVKRGMEEDPTDTATSHRAKAARTDEHRRISPRSQRASPERRNNRSVSPGSVRKHLTSAPRRLSLHSRDGYDRWLPSRQAERRGPTDRSSDYRERHEPRHGSDFSTSTSWKPDLRAGRVRFFLLKSWNYENIATAQREGTWATQTKNEDTFIEAFKTCRHVIFFFSANHSKAFQGYARMQGLPGERGVSEPSWVKNLHWPTTAPFRLRWIVKEETPYRAVGNLKNPLNENLAIFVGRDGQEIPEKLGLQLCDIIDEDTAYRADFRR